MKSLALSKRGLNTARIEADWSSARSGQVVIKKPPIPKGSVEARSIFSHIMLGINDLVASRRFYDAVMPIPRYACEDAGDGYAGCGLPESIGRAQNCFWLRLPADGKPQLKATEPMLGSWHRIQSRLIAYILPLSRL